MQYITSTLTVTICLYLELLTSLCLHQKIVAWSFQRPWPSNHSSNAVLSYTQWALIRAATRDWQSMLQNVGEDDISKRSDFGLSSIRLQACCELGGDMRLVHRDIDKNGNGYFN